MLDWMYLGLRLCSFPDSIMSVAVAARVCQVAYICGHLGVTNMLLCVQLRRMPKGEVRSILAAAHCPDKGEEEEGLRFRLNDQGEAVQCGSHRRADVLCFGGLSCRIMQLRRAPRYIGSLAALREGGYILQDESTERKGCLCGWR